MFRLLICFRMDTSLEGLPADRSRGGSSYRGQMDAEETASMSSFSEDPGERTDRTMSSKTYINSGASQVCVRGMYDVKGILKTRGNRKSSFSIFAINQKLSHKYVFENICL